MNLVDAPKSKPCSCNPESQKFRGVRSPYHLVSIPTRRYTDCMGRTKALLVTVLLTCGSACDRPGVLELQMDARATTPDAIVPPPTPAAALPPSLDAEVPPPDAAPTPSPDGSVPPDGCSEVGLEIIRLVNAYRVENGLTAIPASPSLCTVASVHTRDLVDNAPHSSSECNLHSWSNAGSWSPCCYTRDHAEARCMWDKPRELTSYPGNGYENAVSGTSDPARALASWRGSSGHNAVILNQGIWESRTWRALGAAGHDGYAVLWFGSEVDPVAP